MTTRVAYVLRSFPRWSQGFVLEEMLGLEALGLSLRVFPIVDPGEDVVDGRVADLRAPVRHLGTRWSPPDHLALAGTHPDRYGRTLAAVARWRDEAGGYRTQSRGRSFHQAVRLARQLDAAPVDRIHAAFAHDPALVALLTARLTGLPFSFTAHARDLYQLPPSRLVRRVEAADAVITCTEAGRRHLAALLPPSLVHKVHVVVHGVDLDRFHPPAARPTAQLPVILSAGRLVEKKGFPDLLAAADTLRRRGRRFRLDIHGDGPDRPALATVLVDRGLEDCVRLLPTATRDELAAAYRQAAVFALTPFVTDDGDRDGIPNVLVEAMASGLPVVSTAVGGIPELVVPDRNGLLAPPRAVEALVEHLDRLLDQPAERDRLGAAARATVAEHFDARRSATTLAGLLGEREAVPC